MAPVATKRCYARGHAHQARPALVRTMGRLVAGPYTTNKNLTPTALENQLDIFHYLPSTYNGCAYVEKDRTKPDRWKGKQPSVEGPKKAPSHGRVRRPPHTRAPTSTGPHAHAFLAWCSLLAAAQLYGRAHTELHLEVGSSGERRAPRLKVSRADRRGCPGS